MLICISKKKEKQNTASQRWGGKRGLRHTSFSRKKKEVPSSSGSWEEYMMTEFILKGKKSYFPDA